jgi:predicted GNAT family acetyltransferase
MKLYRFEDVVAFHDRTQPYLLQHEAQQYVLLSFIKALIKFPERYSEPPYLAIVEEHGKIVAITVCLFSQHLVLSVMPNLSAVQLIVDDLYAANRTLLGVSGIVNEAQAFATAWTMQSGQSSHLKIQLRFYQLDAVRPVSGVKGHLRLAEDSDRSLLIEWFEAFSQVVVVEGSETAEQRVASQLSQKVLYIWQDQIPVSLVGTSRTVSGNGMVRSVYTSPEHRKNGYASASVAAVSQILLDQGCKSCYLSTNLKNSTSNRIYQTVGYQPICDWHRYTFE